MFRTTLLSKGAQGYQVALAQYGLNSLGIRIDGKKIRIDGSFLEETESAVKKLQKDYAIKITGRISKLEWDIISNKILSDLKIDRTNSKNEYKISNFNILNILTKNPKLYIWLSIITLGGSIIFMNYNYNLKAQIKDFITIVLTSNTKR